MDTTPKHTTLWASNGGTVVCPDHLGRHGTAMLAAKPKARTLTTPLDRWQAWGAEEIEGWLEFLRNDMGLTDPSGCERCDEAARTLRPHLTLVEGCGVDTPEPKTWHSMSDLHIDITEALEAGKDPEAIAAEFGIALSLVQGVVEERS